LKRTGIDSRSLDAVLHLITKGPVAAPAAAAVVASSNRKAIAADLLRFGEDDVASAVKAASDGTIWAISKRGGEIALSGENIPRSLCLAAVEIIEGNSRPLARRRRKRAT
jgi:hypothetical protein